MAKNLPSGISLGGSITAANTSQAVVSSDVYRGGIKFQNTSDTDMWLNPFGPAAAVGVGFKVTPGMVIDLPNTLGLKVLCTVIGKTFAALEI